MSLALLPEVHLYTDGGSRGNPGPAAIGIVLCDAYEDILSEHRESIGRATNNEAEYQGLLRGLDLAAKYTRRRVKCYTDSRLVVSHLDGSYKVREPRLARLVSAVKEKVGRFQEVSFRQLPRGHPKIRRADELVNLALDERYGRR